MTPLRAIWHGRERGWPCQARPDPLQTPWITIRSGTITVRYDFGRNVHAHHLLCTGSHGDYDGSVWYAQAPLGYNSSGDLWINYYDKPPTSSMYVVTNECLRQCPEAPQLIYNDRHSGANLALSLYSLGVAKLGSPSGDNFGLSRAYAGYVSVPQSDPYNLCLKQECIRTVQLSDLTLAGITYDTSSIDPSKSTGNQFHHQSIVNNSPATVSSTVSGSTSNTQSTTMTFNERITNSACGKKRGTRRMPCIHPPQASPSASPTP